MRVLLAFICSVLILVSQPVIATQTSCSPPKINNQCNSLDVDQSGATGALIPTNALNPIDLFSGNKYLREVDLYAHPETPDLEIVRHYNAMSTHYGSLGGSWTLSYQARLSNTTPVLTLQQANGTLRILSATTGHLEQQPDRFIWHYHNGDKWHFNKAGWLIQIQRQGHAPLIITRHPEGSPLQHLIDQIQQAQHSLQFAYQQVGQWPLLQQIHSTRGAVTYYYEQIDDSALQRLKKAHYPDNRQVHYHYEREYQQQNLWALTGKSIQQSAASPLLRVRSWVYDKEGRAIFYMAERAQHWVRLYFPNKNHVAQTRLHSSQGITYIDFTSPTNSRIQAIQGATCWACPPPLKRSPSSVQFEFFSVQHAVNNENQIHQISGQFEGWPQLNLHYNHQGQLTAWQNALQQRTELFYKNNKAHRILFANGDEQQVDYNPLQQISLIHYNNSQQQLKTQLLRPSPQHLHIKHPNETEKLIFNTDKNIVSRRIHRQLTTPSGVVHWHYKEDFVYDENTPQRLIKHRLPEGGALHYIWSTNSPELHSLEWENAQGERLLIVKKIPQGYEYGNGLQQLEHFSGHVHTLQLQSPQAKQLWWQQRLHLSQGLITAKQQQFPVLHATTAQFSQYSYNQNQQLVIEKESDENHQQGASFYHWDNTGALAAHNKNPLPVVQRDASGLVSRWKSTDKDYILRYNAMRQLDVVYNSVDTVQKNSQNSAGFRIYAQHYPQAIQQFFLYNNKKIVAEYTASFSAKLPVHAAHPVSRRYIYWQNKPVGLIDYTANAAGDLLVMHSDHLGAVHIVSDTKQTVRWAATYDAFGAAKKIFKHPDFHFHLRREGQYFDISTGWHRNLLRTYLPHQGHYLEPDPLGPNPTTQLLGYAKQQPLNHTDPWGLILFSFDGTRYDKSSAGVVHLLTRASKEDSYYAAGPGNAESLDWDAMVAHSTNTILSKQWQTLLYHLSYVQAQMPTTTVPIDIIGFSRGSAIALHFANQIIKHTQNGLFSHTDRFGKQIQACIQPRFMGLLDTVAQMGILGFKNHQYDFTVSPAWQWVVHGVALHEYRALFPLYTLGTGSNLQEVGFIGAHGDLGGGYPMVDDDDLKPLSDVALQWILWNARAQGMQFDDIGLKKYGDYAYAHDESRFWEFDRNLENHDLPMDFENPLRGKQSQHPNYGYKVRGQVHKFMDYKLSAEEKIHNRSAKIDLKAYYRWLDETINWSPD